MWGEAGLNDPLKSSWILSQETCPTAGPLAGLELEPTAPVPVSPGILCCTVLLQSAP